MYFKELLTNFIGTIEENNKNFHQVDEHLRPTALKLPKNYLGNTILMYKYIHILVDQKFTI